MAGVSVGVCGAVTLFAPPEQRPPLATGLLLCVVPLRIAWGTEETALNAFSKPLTVVSSAASVFLVLWLLGATANQGALLLLVLSCWMLLLWSLTLPLRALGLHGFSRFVVAAAAGTALLLPVWWPAGAVPLACMSFTPQAWALGVVMHLDWTRSPGFYELIGDRYCPSLSGGDVRTPLIVAGVCCVLGWGLQRLRRAFLRRRMSPNLQVSLAPFRNPRTPA